MKIQTIKNLSLFLLAGSILPAQAQDQIIPRPLEIKSPEVSAFYQLTKGVTIFAEGDLENEVTYLQNEIKPATGYSLSKGPASSAIRLKIDASLKGLGKEGYTLTVSNKGVEIVAPTDTGVFYGIQSLLQLLPTDIEKESVQQVDWKIPHTSITDKPRFEWRAFMLDEARHFKGEKEVKRLLDQMAELKMNVFQWHLTDDQGWRIEIKKYPKLTSVGSKRKDTQVGGWNSKNRAGEPHQGFYTQEQIKDIVAYAAERHITIVPEIGMPGHASAAIAAYPWLGTMNRKIEVPDYFGKLPDTYNPASERVYQAMDDIFSEVCALFPSKIIHIGGDEVSMKHWKESKEVKALMKREGLATMADVQTYFTNRIAKIVESKNRNIMGWNEIMGHDLHGIHGKTNKDVKNVAKLDPATVVHFWKGSSNLAKQAVKQGHTIVNSTHQFTYLDYGYGNISVEKAYHFNPVIGGLTKNEEKRIIGSGCQMWSEWIPTVERMHYQIFPRLAAYAEVGWTPLQQKDYGSFKKRMKNQQTRWDIQGIHYAKNVVSKVSASDFFNYTKTDSWDAKKTPSDWKVVEISTADVIKTSGKLKVVFLYKKGQHALDINEVLLLENGKVISSDKHLGFSGGELKKVVYELDIKKLNKNAKYTLKANIKGNGGTESYGEIKMIVE